MTRVMFKNIVSVVLLIILRYFPSTPYHIKFADFAEEIIGNFSLKNFTQPLERGGVTPGSGIVFLKTPKCGSTTVSIVLGRVAWKHGLQVGIDIWIDHTPFNPNFHKKIPTSKGQIVGLVRDPGTRLRSGWTWRKDAKYRAKKFGKIYNCSGWDGCCLKALNSSTVRNALETPGILHAELQLHRQSNWHTGVLKPVESTENVSFKRRLTRFHNHFIDLIMKILNGKHLILVMERMDESLLVLRHAYNLSIDDIVYHPKNVGDGVSAIENNSGLEPVRQLEVYDMILYKTANVALDKWIQLLNPAIIADEIRQLQELRVHYKQTCSSTAKDLSSPMLEKDCNLLYLEWDDWNLQFGPSIRFKENFTTV